MTRTLTIEYGDEVLLGMSMSPAEFSAEAKFLLAAKLYELGRVTSGQAAKLCERERADFILSLARVGVPTSNLSEEDAEDELAFGRGG
jgi:predicted HTH domain antitoxin